MLLFYVDESGETNMNRQAGVGSAWILAPGASEWFVLAGVGIHETSRLQLSADIAAIKDRYLPGWRTRPWKETEVKGSHLAHAAQRLANGQQPLKPAGWNTLSQTELDGLVRGFAALFLKYRPIIYAIAVDKKAEIQRAHPRPAEGLAYTYLHQRLALLVDHVFGDVAGALVIADEQQIHEKFFRSGQMLSLRASMTQSLPVQPNFELLLDRPVWINPDWHPLDREILQLPDVVAYAATTLLRTGTLPTAPHCMWTPISTCFATHWASGGIADAGFAIVPRPIAYPGNL